MQSAIPRLSFLRAHWLKMLVAFAIFVLFLLPAILRMLADAAAKKPDGIAAKVSEAIPVTPKAKE